MIIIDTDAELKLAHILAQFLRHAHEMGAASLKFPCEKVKAATLHSVIPALVLKELEGVDSKIYFCEEGEIFILSPELETKGIHRLVLEAAKAFEIPSMECEFRIYDLNADAGRLLTMLETRVSRREAMKKEAHAAQSARQQAELLQAKRQSILDIVLTDELKGQLAKRQNGRKSLEVMMIEDDAFSRRLVGNLLNKEYHLTSLETAESALETYAQVAPDILFLDINLPSVTGHELLEKLLLLDPQAYIVMLSGNADRENVLQAMKRGAKGFVAKPFTPDKLYQYIERCPTFNERKSNAHH